jgi:dihydrolipoamide dehydrogenase
LEGDFMSNKFDLIIIGSGPGGYVAGIRAGQIGLSTAIIEKKDIGGMCLNWGCIPSKTMLESAKLFNKVKNDGTTFGLDGYDKKELFFNWDKAVSRKNKTVKKLVKGVEFLLQKNKVEKIRGEAEIINKNEVKVGDMTYNTDNLIIATGSRPKTDNLNNLKKAKVVELDEFFELKSIPDDILVYGNNPNSCEVANMLNLVGKNVSIVSDKKELVPYLDSDVAEFINKRFKKMGVKLYMDKQDLEDAEDGIMADKEFIKCDMIVNCSDRRPILPKMGDLELEMERSFVKTDEFMQTNIDGVYAIGDITGSMYAQAASAAGTTAVNHIAGVKQPMDYEKIPSNMYTEPEIASVGLTEEQMKERGFKYKVGKFPLSANSKAMAEGHREGFVKILAEEKYGEVMGVHIVSPNATDMINEAVAIMRMEGCLEDVSAIVHTHPAVSETLVEASHVALDKPLHI